MSRGAQDLLVKRIRIFQRKKANRVCFDCGEKGPNAVVVKFNTFICDTCSGIHREFSHRIKGISMSRWTEEEVEVIEHGGNKQVRVPTKKAASCYL